jgi:YaiO family outer membrane protein
VTRVENAHLFDNRGDDSIRAVGNPIIEQVSVPFVVVAMLLATPALACDPTLEAQVAVRPEDSDLRDALARSCARAGEHAEALAHYDRLLGVDPGNVDWLLGKSQALIALQRPREALPLLEDARRRAPDYEDIWRLNVTALDALDEFAAADALLAEAAAQFPAASWPRERRVAVAERRLAERGARLFADLSYEELSGDLPAWKSASLGYTHPLTGARRAFAGLHVEERFDTQDEQILAAWSDRLANDWSWGIAADYSPDAEILPEWSVTAEAGRPLPEAWSLGLRLRHASYATVEVDTLSTRVDKYLGAFSLGYALNVAKTSDISSPSFGHLVNVARDYGDASRVALVVGFGEEAETIAPGVVQVTDTRSVALSGIHWTSVAWAIRWDAGWYEQGDFYDRYRVRLGLERRF